MDKENMIELLEDFIDFLKEKDDKKKVVEVIEDKEDVIDDDDDDTFVKTIDKISKGE